MGTGRATWTGLAAMGGLTLALLARAPGLGLGPPLLLRNDGASMPPGWYRYAHGAPAGLGEVVVLREPPRFRLPWLMKRVVGTAGQRYCWRPELGTQTLDGRPMPPPLPAAVARGVPVWKGCRTLAAGEVVGYGQSADSYDSRYLGPVREADLWGVYRPLGGD